MLVNSFVRSKNSQEEIQTTDTILVTFVGTPIPFLSSPHAVNVGMISEPDSQNFLRQH